MAICEASQDADNGRNADPSDEQDIPGCCVTINRERSIGAVEVGSRPRGNLTDCRSKVSQFFDRYLYFVRPHGTGREGERMLSDCKGRFSNLEPCELPGFEGYARMSFGPKDQCPCLSSFFDDLLYGIRSPEHPYGFNDSDIYQGENPCGHQTDPEPPLQGSLNVISDPFDVDK